MTTPLFSFFVPGIPIAKGRPRFVRATGRTYTPAKTEQAERSIAQFAAEAMRGRPLFSEPIELRIVARYLPPKTRTKAQRDKPQFKFSRPDCDNIIKGLMDAGNGIVWRDDAIIASARVAKIYGDRPGIRVEVWPLTADSWPFNQLVFAEAA